jgi:hypothetical protein
MNEKRKNQPVALLAGVAAVAIYLIFTAIALSNYPEAYSPLTNWLSDLGNPIANPSGAVFYNLGCILTSVILFAFFISANVWNIGDKKIRIFLTIAQIAGILSSIALIITALFPLGPHTAIHSLSGKIHIIFIGFFLTFSATVLLKHNASIKWFAYFGFLSAAVNFVYGAFLNSVFFAEWLAIGMFIIYTLMIAFNSRLLSNEKASAIGVQ